MIKNEVITLIERTNAILNEPAFLDNACAHVANGGSLIELAKALGIRYSDISNWVRQDKERSRRIDRAMLDRAEWSKERILQELKDIALTDVTTMFEDDGTLKPVKDWPKVLAQAVKSIDVVENFEGTGKDKQHIGYTKKITFWNKEKALELLGKNIQLFSDKLEINHKVTLEEVIGESFKGREVNGTEDTSN